MIENIIAVVIGSAGGIGIGLALSENNPLFALLAIPAILFIGWLVGDARWIRFD